MVHWLIAAFVVVAVVVVVVVVVVAVVVVAVVVAAVVVAVVLLPFLLLPLLSFCRLFLLLLFANNSMPRFAFTCSSMLGVSICSQHSSVAVVCRCCC